MSQAAAIPAVSRPFTYDWREIERGLPLSTLEEFSAYSGIAVKDLLEVVISARTLKHRRQKKEPLNLDESDRLARVARLFELAVKVFGDPEKAEAMADQAQDSLRGAFPLSMMHTGLGGQAWKRCSIRLMRVFSLEDPVAHQQLHRPGRLGREGSFLALDQLGPPRGLLAESSTAALVETLVHLEVESEDTPDFYTLLKISIPDDSPFSRLIRLTGANG